MKVNTMRVIDRYVGVPLCLLICTLYRMVEWVLRPNCRQPKNVLLVELSEMGSAVLADPAMRWLSEENCCLHFVIFKSNEPSLHLLDTVPSENIFTIRSDSFVTLIWDSFRFMAWSRRKQIDTTLDLELFSRFTSLLCRLSGAVNRAGYHAVHEEGLYRGNHLTHPLMYNPHIHISQNFMALAHAALGEPDHPYQQIRVARSDIKLAQATVNETQQQEVILKLQELYPDYHQDSYRIMLVNPNASDLLPQRRWMADRFAHVIGEVLLTYQDVLVVITGAPSEREAASRLQAAVGHERCLNSAGIFRFEELVPLYSISDLMLSNDSGPPHFASVTDLQTFVIFGPEIPDLYGTLGNFTPIYAGLACSPCVNASNHRKTSCADNQCLKAITTDQVLEVIKPTLDSLIIAKAS